MGEQEKSMDEKVVELLEGNFWLEGLQANRAYFRSHDDCAGESESGIEVYFDQFGDGYIKTPMLRYGTCRFRTQGGGGKSLRVRNALMILAEAIRLDNEAT